MTGHLAAHYFFEKNKLRRPPSWWLGASSEHYSMHKSVPMDGSSIKLVSEDGSSPCGWFSSS